MKIIGRKFAIRSHQGFVLFTSLIFLVMITIIVVFAIRSATVQERMSGNLRNHSQAFQAAEYALHQAQLKLSGTVTMPASGCSQGLCASTDATVYNTISYWANNPGNSCLVTDANCSPNNGSISASLSAQPRFVIQPASGFNSPTCTYYQISAIGYGSNSNSYSIIRALVKSCA